MMSLALFLSLLFFYSLISEQLERTILTAPIVFTLMFFIALAAARTEGPAASLLQFIVEQLGYGLVIGLGLGLAGGWLLGLASRKGWIAETSNRSPLSRCLSSAWKYRR